MQDWNPTERMGTKSVTSLPRISRGIYGQACLAGWLFAIQLSGPREGTRVNKGALVNTRQVERNGYETTASQVVEDTLQATRYLRTFQKVEEVYLSSNLQRWFRRSVSSASSFATIQRHCLARCMKN